MTSKPEADRDELLLILVAQALAGDLDIKDASWDTIPKMDATTLKKAVNEGIPPDKVRLRLVKHSHPDGPGEVHYVVAAFDDVEGDFWARYIVQGSWLVAKYEN